MEIKDLLLTWNDYNKKEFSSPYIYSIKKGPQLLTYFGARHDFDPTSEQFKKIEAEWQKFLQATKDGRRIVFIESRVRKTKIEDSNKAIIESGEGGYVTFLAQKENIDVICPEPTSQEVGSELIKTYTKEQIMYHVFAQVLYQWNKLKEKPEWKSYVSMFLERDKKDWGWSEFDVSIENMMKIHGEFFGTPFDHTDKTFFYNVIDPSQNNGVFNEIGRAVDMVRDPHIVKAIKEKWNQGYNIFIIYGSGHAVVQEPAFKVILN